MFLTLLKILKSDFKREGAYFQEGVVGGKMNSETIGQRVKVVKQHILWVLLKLTFVQL